MDLSPDKREILEALLLHEKPVKAAQVAKEIAKDPRAVQMHLIGLTRMDYADSPEKGQYKISINGKKALGLPEDTLDVASAILSQKPNAAFHFYAGIGKPLQVYAKSLTDFCDKIEQVSLDSVEFHMNRGDFEAWFKSLGDLELTKKTALLKERKFSGEELRAKIRETARNRCEALSRIAGLPAPFQ